MVARRSLPPLLVLALLLPGLAMPWAEAQSADEQHYLNVNQAIALPGSQVSYTVSGRVGEIALRVYRVDATQVRDFAKLGEDAGRERVLDRTLTLAAGSQSWDGASWGVVTDTLALETPGLYLLETQRGQSRQHAWLQVTTHSFFVKSGPQNAVLYAFHLGDGVPLAGARVVLNGTDVGATDRNGLLPLDAKRLDGPLVVSAGGVLAVGDLATQAWWGAEPDRVVIHTDRPIYRPGQTAHLKVMAFQLRGDRYVPSDAEAIRVKVSTWSRGTQEIVHESTLKPNEHGSVALSVPLRDDAPLGYYNVEVVTSEDATGWGGFQVDAYKKPRIDVVVEPSRAAYAAGEEVVVRASAHWFFGSPLNRGQVTYRIHGEPWYGGWDCIYCGYGVHADFVPFSYPPIEEVNGEGTLRDDGTFVFSWTPKSVVRPTTAYVSVHVTAESGERQEGTASITLQPASYGVEVSTSAYAIQKGGELRATATVRDLDGRPVAGVPVDLRLVEERGGAGFDSIVSTDAQGRAVATLTPSGGGGHRVHASVVDPAGRRAESTQWLWVVDELAPWWHTERVTLVPEKTSYAPGETARVVVLATKPTHVLVALEGRDLHAWKHVYVEGNALVEFPLEGGYAPQVSITATAVELTEGSYPQVHQRSVEVSVLPDPRVLDVTLVPEKPAYRDGDEARVLVQVRDAEGRPVEGEVALSIVDEAIYRLAEAPSRPLTDSLYAEGRGVNTWFPWWTLRTVAIDLFRGRASWNSLEFADAATGVVATPMALSAKSFDGASTIKVREEFPDTALWLPFLRTDATGTARVRLTAPDTLTEWRVSAIAHTLDGLAGEGRGAFHTRKPLMVELSAPRFFVQGDALNVTAVVFNHLGELRDVEVQLLGEGAMKVPGSGYRRVTLSDGDSARLDFPVLATDDASALANLTVLVLSRGADNGTESDAMRLRLPVLPHGVVQKAVRAGTDDATFTLPVPPGPYAAPPRLSVTLTPSMAGAVLDALPHLLGYPYGCVEQTMSRFMPAVVATRALVGAGYDAEDPALPEYVEKGLERLLRFQHADGGWGWWTTDQTHPYMTAYVVAGLAEARRAGVEVDEEAFGRGVAALQNLLNATGEPDMQAYQAYALALAGAPPTSWPSDADMSLDGVALLGLAKLEAGDEAGAQRLLDRLMERAVPEPGRLHWEGGGARWGGHGIRSDVQLTAHALRLMVGLGKEDDAPQAVAWLAQKRQGAWWSTTKDTSESVLAIVDYLATVDELSPDYDALVTMGGETHRVPFHGDAKSLQRRTLDVTLPADAWGKDVPVQIAREGEGRLYWSAVLASTPRAEVILPESQGLGVTKRILDKDGAETTALRFGEEYTVVVDVSTGTERHFLLLHDPLPAGVEVVETQSETSNPWARNLVCWLCGGWGWPWSNVERRDDHVAAFATTLWPGETSLSYRIRAVHPGSYHVLPATVEEMYAPEIHGRSGELHVAIGDVPRLLLGDALVTDAGVSLRVFPLGGSLLRLHDVEVDVLDQDGAVVPLAETPEVVLLEDGSLEVSLATEIALPDVFTVSLRAPAMEPVTRTFDRTGAPLRFEGAFSDAAQAAWSAGPVVDATTAATRSEPGDPSLIVRPEPQPDPVDPQPPASGPDEPETRGVPGAGALLVGLAVLCALPLVRRRRQ